MIDIFDTPIFSCDRSSANTYLSIFASVFNEKKSLDEIRVDMIDLSLLNLKWSDLKEYQKNNDLLKVMGYACSTEKKLLFRLACRLYYGDTKHTFFVTKKRLNNYYIYRCGYEECRKVRAFHPRVVLNVTPVCKDCRKDERNPEEYDNYYNW